MLFATLCLSAILFLPACGQEQEIWEEAPYTDTLSIHALYTYGAIFRLAEASLNAALAEEGRSIQLEVSTFGWDEIELQRARLQIRIMAGQGYDMYIWEGLPLWIHSDSGLFANFYDLIDQCPNSSREDFFTHVLEAWETNGALYLFPLSFEFSYVAISANLPQSILDQFTQLSTVTMQQLLQIYLDLQERYGDEFGHMALGSSSFMQRIPSETIVNVIGDFIDFGSRTSDLNSSEFVAYLEYLGKTFALAPDGEYWNHVIATFGATPEMWYELSNQSVFLIRRDSPIMCLGHWDAFFGQDFFVNFIPLSCRDGNLIISQFSHSLYDTEFFQKAEDNYPSNWVREAVPRRRGHLYSRSPAWGSVCVSASADGSLAWQYTNHLLTTLVNYETLRLQLLGSHPLDYQFRLTNRLSPIREECFNRYYIMFFEHAFANSFLRNRYNIPLFGDGASIMFADVFSRMEALNAMPVMVTPYIPSALYESPLQDFLIGLITAQEAADLIHNRIALWLIE